MSFCFAGNKRVVETVEQFIAERRIPHAVLIEGETGTGKRTLATFLSDAAVCAENNAPCGKCRNCLLSAGKNHPDIIKVSLLEDKKNITVNQIREVRASSYVKAHMGGNKVIVIENAETMNEQAQNALLKVLEEPPKNVIFILIVQNASMMLDTIISRCVVLSLTVPKTEEAADYLKYNLKADYNEIIEALKSSRNNIGRALSLLSEKDKKDDIVRDFAEALIMGKGVYELLKLSYPLEKSRVACAEFVKNLKTILAEEICLNTKKNLSVEKLINYYDILADAQPSLETNINISLFLNALICNLCSAV